MAAMHELLLVAAAGVIAGAMNALAGGGSFVTLPALIALRPALGGGQCDEQVGGFQRGVGRTVAG
jgi:uncharacterized membrane protein YfcA